MTLDEAVKILRDHNEWHLGADTEMCHPIQLGIATEKVCDAVNSNKINVSKVENVTNDWTPPEWHPMSTAPRDLVLLKSTSGFICSGVPELNPIGGVDVCTAFIDMHTPIRIRAEGWMPLPKTLTKEGEDTIEQDLYNAIKKAYPFIAYREDGELHTSRQLLEVIDVMQKAMIKYEEQKKDGKK